MRKVVGQVWFPALLLVLLALMIWSPPVATLAAGISLFVLGIGRLEAGFRAFSGGALERWLKWSTSRLWKSILVGALGTVVVQSSTLVTLLGIAFLSAGLINTLGGVGLVLGANLGTTSGAWLIALTGVKLEMLRLAMPMLVFGVLLARRENSSWNGVGLALLGLGLLFLGIDLMKTGFGGFEGAADLGRYPVEGWTGIALFLLGGVLATVLMQSSQATLVLTLTALAAGQIPYENALSVVIGANLGSTAGSLFAAIGSNNAGRRIAAAHLIYNLVTATGAVLLLPHLAAVIEFVARLMGLAPDAYIIRLAMFHTLYNLFGLTLVTPWSIPLARGLERWLPDSVQSSESGGARLSERDRSRALYLNESALLHADTALTVLDQELQHLAQLSRQVVGAALYLPARLADIPLSELSAEVRQPVAMAVREDADALYEHHIKGVYADIVDFISHVDVSLSPAQQQSMVNAATVAGDLVAAVKAAKHLQKNLRSEIDSSQPATREAYRQLREYCALSLLELHTWVEQQNDPQVLEQLLEQMEAQGQQFSDDFQREVQQQLRSGELDGWRATSLLNDLHYLLRIHRHLHRAHAVMSQVVRVDDGERIEQAISLA